MVKVSADVNDCTVETKKISFGRPKTVNLMLVEFKQVCQLCSIIKENNTI